MKRMVLFLFCMHTQHTSTMVQAVQAKTMTSAVHALNTVAQRHITQKNFVLGLFLSSYAVIWIPILSKLSKKIYIHTVNNNHDKQIQAAHQHSIELSKIMRPLPTNHLACLRDLDPTIQSYVETLHHLRQQKAAAVHQAETAATLYVELVNALAPLLPHLTLLTWLMLFSSKKTVASLDEHLHNHAHTPPDPIDPHDENDDDDALRWIIPPLHIATILLIIANQFIHQ